MRPMPTPAERRALIFLTGLVVLGVAVRAVEGAPPSADAASLGALQAQIAAVDSARRAARVARSPSTRATRVNGSRRTASRAVGASGRRRSGTAGMAAPRPGAAGGGSGVSYSPDAARAPYMVAAPMAGVATRVRGRAARQALAAVGSGAASAVPSISQPTRAPGYLPGASDAAPLDLDRATAAEIERLPRIGPVLAARIVADRDSLGPFGSLEGLMRVRGIGPATARVLASYVTFSLSPRPSGADRGGGQRQGKGALRQPP